MIDLKTLQPGDKIKALKPWWKFWFTPWTLRVTLDYNHELWTKDPYGAWYAKVEWLDPKEWELVKGEEE